MSWVFYIKKNTITRNIIVFFSNKLKAIAALKGFWIFFKLRLWDDYQLGDLTNKKMVLDIILKRQGLLVGWHYLVSRGLSIKINRILYGDNSLFRFNITLGKLLNSQLDDQLEQLSALAGWDLDNSQINFTQVLNKVVENIRTQGQLRYSSSYNFLMGDPQPWHSNPLSLLSDKKYQELLNNTKDSYWFEV